MRARARYPQMAHEKSTDQTARELPAAPVYNLERDTEYRKRYKKSGYYGVMFAPEYTWDIRRCIEEAYGGAPDTPRSGAVKGRSRRSLKFHTDWLDRDAAVDHVTAVPPYNRFDPDAVSDALDRVPESTRVVLGRESSPVLYLWTDSARTVMDLLANIPHDENHETESIFSPAGPDELGAVPASEVSSYPLRQVGIRRECVRDGTAMLIRAWWD